MGQKIVLVDGHSILNRAFYALPPLTNSDGKHTNAVYGFLTMLFKTLEDEQPEYLTVAFDMHAPTFRHEIYAAYKGTRKPMPPELREQVPLIKEVLQAMGILIVQKEGYEADDILGTLAKKSEGRGFTVTVLSGDRDLLQLASDEIKIRIPKTKAGKTIVEEYYAAQVLEAYQVTPEQIVDMKALMGDASDNIPGIPGVGEKTASKIIAEYGSIENAYAHVDEIKPNKARESLRDNYEQAVLSKRLAEICVDSPIEYDWDNARLTNMYTPEAYGYFRELEFKNLLSRFSLEEEAEDASQEFCCIEDLSEAENLFAAAAKERRIGVYLAAEAGELLGVAIAYRQDQAAYVPVGGFLTADYLCEKIRTFIAIDIEIVVLDVKAFLKYIEIPYQANIMDIGIGAYLLNPLKSGYTYDDIAKEYAGMMIPSAAELIGKNSLTKVATEKLLKYAGYGAYVPFATASAILEQLAEKGMDNLYREIEMPLVFALYDMEKAGIRVEAEALKIYGSQLEVRIRELEAVIYKQAGEEFNINSPKQLGVILFEKMGLPGGKKTKTGYSTAADVLEKLAVEYGIVSDILEYRQLTKLKSTYADGLANYIGADGRIHSNFNQTITATGRISSTEPNLQNIPVRMELGRLIRKVFIPEDGYVFIDADYSQIELRVLAHFSQDERLIQAYQEAKDIHRITASQVFHTPFDEVTSLQRRNAKAVNFGIVYGISSFGLSQDLSISRKEAAEYIKKYFETYPKIKEFLDKTVEDAKKDGYVTTLFGRRRPIPELSSSNFMQRSFGERVAMNSPIQGTAADIIKIAMIRVNRRLKEQGLRSRIVLQVHDELLIEAHQDEVLKVSDILRDEMQKAADLSVPLEVDMHKGENWYEAK